MIYTRKMMEEEVQKRLWEQDFHRHIDERMTNMEKRMQEMEWRMNDLITQMTAPQPPVPGITLTKCGK